MRKQLARMTAAAALALMALVAVGTVAGHGPIAPRGHNWERIG